ncbi:predicted protein [Botrytis cinerea T4]|uniref:Uncharacterized protein n=1 Tax=Botryotinia fuckeliana (strain T4) TaxID=999810 RepID=G2YMM5_BOTF4|nr:predicted protein [Botrytis cinerea T4]
MEMELDTSTGTYFYDLPYLWNMSRLLKAQGWISSDINWLQLDDPHLYPPVHNCTAPHRAVQRSRISTRHASRVPLQVLLEDLDDWKIGRLHCKITRFPIRDHVG